MRSCIARKPGIIRAMMTPIATARTGTATTSTHDNCDPTLMPMMMPPMHMMGAITRMVVLMTINNCTCWTSLVVRVINDGAPNVPISLAE